jgi:hypothetical protein
MRKAIYSYYLIVSLSIFFIGVTIRWVKYKYYPIETVSEETFKIDRSMVKNAQANKTYFGTVKIIERKESLSWPKVETKTTYDTLTVEEGGYFGVPN